jgi:hypothetical protein
MSAEDERAARYQALLARHVAMNAQTWGVLQTRGVSETTPVSLAILDDHAYRPR